MDRFCLFRSVTKVKCETKNFWFNFLTETNRYKSTLSPWNLILCFRWEALEAVFNQVISKYRNAVFALSFANIFRAGLIKYVLVHIYFHTSFLETHIRIYESEIQMTLTVSDDTKVIIGSLKEIRRIMVN